MFGTLSSGGTAGQVGTLERRVSKISVVVGTGEDAGPEMSLLLLTVVRHSKDLHRDPRPVGLSG